MARFYYTDPLKVEWMRREFGFKFMMGANPFADDFNFVYLNLETSLMYGLEYNIALDSCEMLEPQEGDLLRHRDGFVGLYDDNISKLGFARVYMGCSAMHDSIERFEIIQRNNKAFYTPEVEGD